MPAITDVNDLQDMNLDLAGTYWLANDIDASATVGWNGGAGFIPVGTAANKFTGTFDAKDHSISDLFINRPGTDYIGLFGYTDGATIQDTILIDPVFTGEDYVGPLAGLIVDTTIFGITITNATVVGESYVGGAIGAISDCAVSDCSASGTVTAAIALESMFGGFSGYIGGDSTVTSCHANVTVAATGGEDAGGFVGLCGTVAFSKCYSLGDVTGSDDLGGFCGDITGLDVTTTFTDCYARGDVAATTGAGGFAAAEAVWGTGSVTFTNCYSTGVVSGSSVGGFMEADSGNTTYNNCFWDTQTSGTAVSAGGTGKTTSEMKTKATFTAAGWDFIIIWFINGVTNDGYAFHFAMPPEPIESPRETVDIEDKITLECVRNIEMAAGGRFYIDKEGKAVYKSRYARNA